MAKWRVEQTEQFKKDVRAQRNNPQLLLELEKKLRRLEEDPKNVGGTLGGDLHGFRSTRLLRKFRLVFSVDEVRRVVFLAWLDHRKSAYG